MNAHVSTLRLHQLRLGELDKSTEAQLRGHLSECALCRARAAHQVATRLAFEQTPVPSALNAVLSPARSPWRVIRTSRWAPVLAVLPLAAAALLVVQMGEIPRESPASESIVVVSPPFASPSLPDTTSAPMAVVAPAAPKTMVVPPQPPATSTRIKGVTLPKLEAWVQTGDSARPLYTGETLGQGSRVQLRYDAMGKRFVTLAGRDSNGVVEIYATLPTSAAGLTSAPFSLTLDDSKGEQVFFAIATDLRPDAAALQAALSVNPVRMDGAVVASLVLRKD